MHYFSVRLTIFSVLLAADRRALARVAKLGCSVVALAKLAEEMIRIAITTLYLTVQGTQVVESAQAPLG